MVESQLWKILILLKIKQLLQKSLPVVKYHSESITSGFCEFVLQKHNESEIVMRFWHIKYIFFS